jgi:CheY-like chemotaxis protein
MLRLLGRILAKNDKIILVGSATDGQKAVRSASTLHLDLAVLDLHMPGLVGAEATRLLKELPNPPTIFVVSLDDV